MFMRARIRRNGGGVILYVIDSIEAYEIKLERQAYCNEAVWCKVVSENSTLTIGLVYRSPNINEEELNTIWWTSLLGITNSINLNMDYQKRGHA